MHLVQSQPNDLDPMYPMILCSLNMGYDSLPISYFLFSLTLSPPGEKKEAFESVGSFDISIWDEL